MLWSGGRAADTLFGRFPLAPPAAMKINVRSSTAKKAKKTGYRTRQRTAGGRKVNARQRKRHGSF